MRWILLTTIIFVSACSTTIKQYAQTTPTLKLDQFFNGKLTAYGIVQNRQGEVLRRFTVDMIGTWDGNRGVLDEQFYYSDGAREQRIWYLTKHSDGTYSGDADDVVKPASGESSGFALNWKYTLSIEVDGRNWDIDFNDWMYLIDEQRLVNRAEMTKWGFRVGEVTLFIEKEDPTT